MGIAWAIGQGDAGLTFRAARFVIASAAAPKNGRATIIVSVLRDFLHHLYHGPQPGSIRFRYGLLAFDLSTIAFFVVTTFLPPYEWIIVVDFLIGAILVLDLAARASIARDRLHFLLQPASVVDMVVIVSLLAPTVTERFLFLRVLRALRLLPSYHVLRELREHRQFFAHNEEIVFSALNLVVFVFIVSAPVYVLLVRIKPVDY